MPREAIVLPRDVRATPVLRSAAAWADRHLPPDGLTDWQLLCLWLCWHAHLGPRSAWAPYLAVVPSEAALAASLAHPLVWPEPVAEAILAGSGLLARGRPPPSPLALLPTALWFAPLPRSAAGADSQLIAVRSPPPLLSPPPGLMPSQGRLLSRGETCRDDLAALRAAVEGAAAAAEEGAEAAAELASFLPKLTEGSVRWAASLVLSRAFYFDVRLRLLCL